MDKLLKILKWSMDSYNSTTGHLYEEDGVDCQECKNRGNFMQIKFYDFGTEENFPYEEIIDCACMGERKNKTKIKKSGLSSLLDKRFDTYIARNELQQALKNKAFKNTQNKEWFYIGGQSGFGKTHICSAICNELLNLGNQVKYSIWTKDFKELNYLAINDYKKYEKQKEALETANILYIDDLFKSQFDNKLTSRDIEITYDILNYRYNNNLKTIISSEYTLSGLTKVDEALMGRIVEKAGEYTINIEKDLSKNWRLNNIK